MKRLSALLLLVLVAAAPKTVTRKGLCSFRVPAGWKTVEDWKATTPNALLKPADPKAGPIAIQVLEYKAGNVESADLAAYTAQVMLPNQEFEKKVSSAPAQLDGRPATLFRVENLDILYVTAKFGPKTTIKKDFIAAEYPGGFVVAALSSPAKDYEAREKEFAAFLKGFKILAPKPAPPVVTGSSVPFPSPKKP